MAAVSINLGKDGIEPHLADILSPVYRELELATTFIGIYTVESTKDFTVDNLTIVMLIKTGYLNLRNGCGFLCFNLMNC